MILVKRGEAIQFDYLCENGISRGVQGRLVKIRDCQAQPISFEARWYGKRIVRSRHLLTLATSEGFKAYYVGRIGNVRRLSAAARLINWLCGKSFVKSAFV